MKDKIKEFETALSVIQRGLAWKLQYLDISINKMFKESLEANMYAIVLAKTI